MWREGLAVNVQRTLWRATFTSHKHLCRTPHQLIHTLADVPYAVAEDKLRSKRIGSGASANVYCACAVLKEQTEQSAWSPCKQGLGGVCTRSVRADEVSLVHAL